jgi:hypothetical protein
MLLGVGAALVLLAFANGIYPARAWLLRTVLVLWFWQLYLATAFVAAGDLVVWRVLKLRDLNLLTRLALAAPAGAVVFAAGMFLGGFLALYGATFAIAWPAVMLGVATAVHGRRVWPGSWRSERGLMDEPAAATRTSRAGHALVSGFGVLCIGALYLGAFSPDAVNYDAAWSHLVVAETYAREGRIVPFLANWPATLPHLASIFYTWGFLVPGLGRGAPRWMMALHTELAFLVWTLVGVGAALQMCTGRRTRGGWAVFFLFPGIFVYDNNLGASADHVLAFFAVPALVAAIRGAETLDPGWWAFFGITAAGGLMTKFQSAYCLFPSALILAAGLSRGVWHHFGPRSSRGLWHFLGQHRLRHRLRRGGLRERMRGEGGASSSPPKVGDRAPPRGQAEPPPGPATAATLWRAPLAALTCVVGITAPHFIRNWVFYGNPVYPMAQTLFTRSHPSIPGSALLADNIISHWGTKPPAELLPRVRLALELFWTFSFHPHAGFTGDVPVVGSLFTLSLPLILVVPAPRRARIAVAAAACAVFLWAFTYWVDRNLQGFIPLLAVATGSVLIGAWHLGRLARVGVIALVGAQLAWSGDHFLNGSDRIASALALIRSGYDGRSAERFDDFRRPYVDLDHALPPRSRLLLHSIHGSLGIDREVLLDWPGFQGLIDPCASRTPRELFDRYQALGITHVLYQPGLHPSPVKQDDVIFGALRMRYESITRGFGPFRLFQLPSEPPPVEPPYRVLVSGIGGYQDGVYRVEDLSTLEGLPPELQRHASPAESLAPGHVAQQIDRTQALLLGNGTRLEPAASAKTTAQFQLVVGYSQFQVFVRRP